VRSIQGAGIRPIKKRGKKGIEPGPGKNGIFAGTIDLEKSPRNGRQKRGGSRVRTFFRGGREKNGSLSERKKDRQKRPNWEQGGGGKEDDHLLKRGQRSALHSGSEKKAFFKGREKGKGGGELAHSEGKK